MVEDKVVSRKGKGGGKMVARDKKEMDHLEEMPRRERERGFHKTGEIYIDKLIYTTTTFPITGDINASIICATWRRQQVGSNAVSSLVRARVTSASWVLRGSARRLLHTVILFFPLEE